MGLWKQVKTAWDPQGTIKALVEEQVAGYRSNQDRYPERDPNAWLAITLQSRSGWEGKPEWWYHRQTAPFSLAPGLKCTVVLALHILRKEEPRLAEKYHANFFSAIEPINELRGKGLLYIEWRRTNPWTAENFPEIAEAVRSDVLTMPVPPLELELPPDSAEQAGPSDRAEPADGASKQTS